MSHGTGFRLSDTQFAFLKRLHEGKGWETQPAGYSKAGPDASRWWRTAKILMEHGLVFRREGQTSVNITDAGRACVSATWREERS